MEYRQVEKFKELLGGLTSGEIKLAESVGPNRNLSASVIKGRKI